MINFLNLLKLLNSANLELGVTYSVLSWLLSEFLNPLTFADIFPDAKPETEWITTIAFPL